MKIKREGKWVVAGLLGAFLLWYFLIGPILTHSSKMGPTNATAVGLAVQGTTTTATNSQMAQFRTWQPPEWMSGATAIGYESGISVRKEIFITNMEVRILEPPRWNGLVPGQPGSGYSLGLIDDIHPEALPMPKE